MANKKRNLQRNFMEASIREAEGGGDGVFLLSFSSEEPYDRGYCIEILDHGEGAADFTRLNGGAPLLFNHDRDAVLGKIRKAWIENGRGNAEVEFYTKGDPKAEAVYNKVKDGILGGVSIGYRINEVEDVKPGATSKDGRFSGPCCVVRNWEALEISIVSVPADFSVGVGRDADDGGESPSISFRKHAPSVRERQLQININKIF